MTEITPSAAQVHRTGGARLSRIGVSVLVTAGALMVMLAIAVAVALDAPFALFVESFTLTNIVIGTSLLSSGGILAWFRPSNVVGWLLLVCGTGHLIAAAAAALILWGTDAGWPENVTRSLTTVFHTGWLVGLPGLFLLALLLFPTGHLPSRRWLPLAIAIVVVTGYNIVSAVLGPTALVSDQSTVSILSTGYRAPPQLAAVISAIEGALYILVGASLVVRYVRGDESHKRQLLWLILAFFSAGLLNSQRWITGEGPILPLLGVALFPIAIAIAILHDQLLDIRLVVSRTVVYALTIGATIVAYSALVAGLTLVAPPTAERSVPIAAAILVALAFNPLRLVIQRFITRAFYGNRADQLKTVLMVSQQLQQSDDDLSMLLDRARRDLQLPYLGLRRESDGATIAWAGTLADQTPTVSVELLYRGERVSTLVVALRRGEATLHEADRRALGLVAVPLSVAQHALELAEQLRSARSATAQVRERERKRLHRELHDGLGPALTGMAFQADAAFNLVRNDPDRAAELLGRLGHDLRSSIGDVRRVVYGLRPVELDKYGFDGAMQRRISGVNDDPGQTLTVQATFRPERPEFPPATELAAYRITVEALENVLRHSDGTICTVSVSVDSDVSIIVEDNGGPVLAWSPGVGIESMVDRAEELGGSATIGPSLTGWRVEARLPLSG